MILLKGNNVIRLHIYHTRCFHSFQLLNCTKRSDLLWQPKTGLQRRKESGILMKKKGAVWMNNRNVARVIAGILAALMFIGGSVYRIFIMFQGDTAFRALPAEQVEAIIEENEMLL